MDGVDTAVCQAYAWFVVGALALANMMSYVERQVPTLLFGPIKRSFRINDTEVSLLAGVAFSLFYVGFGLVAGRLADRGNRQRIITVGIGLWGLATMSCGLALSFGQLFFSRVLVGVGEATLGPSAISMLSDYFSPDRLARALSVYTGAQYLGAGFALVVGGFVLDLVGALPSPRLPLLGTLAPWQSVFFVVGALALLVSLPMLFVREPPRQGLDAGTTTAGSSFAQTRAFLRANWKTYTAHFTAFSISGAVGFGTVAWMPTFFIRTYHIRPQDIGYIYGLMLALLGGAGVLAGAHLAEWLGSRGYRDTYWRTSLIMLAVSAVPASLAPLMPTESSCFAVLAVATFFSSFPVALIIAALQVITPNAMRGQVVALFFFLASILGNGLGPTLVAVVTDYVFGNEAMVGAAISTVTVAITPFVVIILLWGLKPYRESLDRAAKLAAAS
jgi:MFS family permease